MIRSAARARALGRRLLSSAAGGPYDVVVVGGGPGGYVAAIKGAQLGLKVACVEKRGALGGTCLNVGCIPSKALLHASHMYAEAEHSFPKNGITVTGLSVDVPTLMKQKTKSVVGLTSGIEGLFKKNKVDYVKGFGKVSKAGEVEVDLNEGGTQTLQTKHTIIATGSEPASLPGIEVDEKRIVTSTGALELERVPETMTVIGGGVIGLELGSVWSRLGAKVTVVEFLDRITPGIDKEVATTFMRSLKKQGIDFKMSTKVNSADTSGDKVRLELEPSKGGDKSELEADVVLVATGRRPFLGGVDVEGLGLETEGPFLKVDHWATNVPGIWAIGDATPGPMLAHKAEEEGIAAVEQIHSGTGHVNYDAIPGVIYTHPEVATVGKTEEELKAAGVKYAVGKFPILANSRARANDDADGLVKILTDKETDRMLGVHIVSAGAGELIAEAVLGLEYGASSEDIARTCHAHPTMSEAVKEAAMAAHGKAIHF